MDKIEIIGLLEGHTLASSVEMMFYTVDVSCSRRGNKNRVFLFISVTYSHPHTDPKTLCRRSN